jgi:hypothetical protein
VENGMLSFQIPMRLHVRVPHTSVVKKARQEKTMKSKVMYKLALIGFASICAVLPSAAAQSSVKAETDAVSITGKVSCSRFGRGSVTARKGMSVAQTIWYCANFQGGQYTLVSGNRIYALSGDPKQLAKMSGQTVTVAGHMVPESADTAAVAFMGTVAVTEVVPTKE